MSDSEHDDEFEAYLKRRVPADKRVGPLDPLEPPPELDRLVIGKARKAIQGGSSIHLYRAPKWALPVGLAATILLSFAILLDLGVRAKRNDESLQAPGSQSSGIPTSQSRIGAAEPQSVAPTAAAASSATAASSGANVSEASDEEEGSSDSARTRLARAEKAAKRARPEQEMANRAVQEVFVTGQRKGADDATSTPAPIAAAPAAPVEAAPPRRSSEAAPFAATPAPQAPSPTVTDKAAGKAAAPASPAVSSGASGSSATGESSAAGSEGASKAANPDPASWLARIEKLRSEGHTAEAEREMKRFRSAYPDYALPKADTP